MADLDSCCKAPAVKGVNGNTDETNNFKEKADECPPSPSVCVSISPKWQTVPNKPVEPEKHVNERWYWSGISVYHVGWFVFLAFLSIYISLSRAHGWRWSDERQLSLNSLPVQTRWRLLITPRVSCAEDPPFVALITMTGAADAEAREVVRRTWGGVSRVGKRRVRLFFLLGTVGSQEVQQAVEKEAETFGDILQHSAPDLFFLLGTVGSQEVQQAVEKEAETFGDILQHSAPDKYRNLTYKTITAFRWVTESCPEAKFLVKADADVLIDMNKLLGYLNAHQDETDVAAGVLRTNIPAIRDPSNKNYEDPGVYSASTYPPYLSGPLYIVSRDLVAKIAAVAKWLPVLSNEDCFIGTCLQALGVQPQSTLPGAMIDVFFNNSGDISELRNWMAIHPVVKEKLLTLWGELH
ncbi:uncharacterized protein EMH_0028240 [Eimeria mitis]|uniref:Hexosyltransferase n=1 Tax=Eimeria mitis TaxID=44415 RepID=U6K3N7_9EIME|nr:uncharacterized protein EMH_0028240 [Eimeria mitis]CDJ30358.1 hypothetical protein, conserved [Eimeria mitis]